MMKLKNSETETRDHLTLKYEPIIPSLIPTPDHSPQEKAPIAPEEESKPEEQKETAQPTPRRSKMKRKNKFKETQTQSSLRKNIIKEENKSKND